MANFGIYPDFRSMSQRNRDSIALERSAHPEMIELYDEALKAAQRIAQEPAI